MAEESGEGVVTYRNLQCELTEDEVRDRARRVASLLGERDSMELARKSADKKAKGAIKEVAEEISEMAEQVRDEKEWRDVECVWIYNAELKSMELVRQDIEEVIQRRSLNDRERQLHLFKVVKSEDDPDDAPEDEPDVEPVASIAPDKDMRPEHEVFKAGEGA